MLVQNPEKDEQMTHTYILVQNYMKRWDPGPRRSTNWSNPGIPGIPVWSRSPGFWDWVGTVYTCVYTGTGLVFLGTSIFFSDPGTPGAGLVQDERVLRAALDTHRLYITSGGGASVNYIAVSCWRTEQLTSFWLKVLDSHRLHIITSGDIDKYSV